MADEFIGERSKEDSILGLQRRLVSDRVVMFPKLLVIKSVFPTNVLMLSFFCLSNDMYCYFLSNTITICSYLFYMITKGTVKKHKSLLQFLKV